jgi:glutathione peroxidase
VQLELYELHVKKMDGTEAALSEYKGKALLIVNTATGCGFTPHYKGLQELYEKYREQGFEILDFPCNQFGHQAPGTGEEIHDFCTGRFGIMFPQFAKVNVNGRNESPLFTYLKKETGGFLGTSIKWNFTKFLVDKKGNVVARYGSAEKPEDLAKDIAALL